MPYKSSFYNVLTPAPEFSEFLLFNLLTGGLEVLPQNEGEYMQQIIDSERSVSDTELTTPFLTYLFEKGFFVDSATDEKLSYSQSLEKNRDHLFDRDESSINLTIGTTIMCNMGCAYCFEFEKPNKSLRSQENISGIIYYIRDMINKSPVKKWNSLNVTWYGGEPLINKGAISAITPELLKLCAEEGLSYNASIITNGILLTRANWTLLEENKVTTVQITLDGPERIHDKSRPLKGNNAGNRKNYHQILENLTMIPENLKVVIRINTDRQVAECFDEMFDDFKLYGIWPQRFRNINFSPAWLRTYEEANESDLSHRLSVDEFFDFLQLFRKRRLQLFNEWADENLEQKAKLKWMLPELQQDCPTWVSPYSLVVDPDGNIHKCWETIHSTSDAISHVSEGFDLEKHRKFMAYDRANHHPICQQCKFMPVCDKLSCSQLAVNAGKPPCTFWKNKTQQALLEQYTMMKTTPDLIAMPKMENNINTGHSNK